MKAIFERNDNLIFISDEVHEHLNGMANKQNCRYWATENSKEARRLLRRPKLAVLCAIGKAVINGSFLKTTMEMPSL